jgi:hypothetical protein
MQRAAAWQAKSGRVPIFLAEFEPDRQFYAETGKKVSWLRHWQRI